jgi:hypothetical protein
MFRLLVARLQVRFLSNGGSSSEGGLNAEETRSMYGDTVDAAPRARKLLAHPVYQQVIMFVTFFRMWLCFQYGVLPTAVLDTVGLFFVLFTVLEVVYRVMAFSWRGFWVAND